MTLQEEIAAFRPFDEQEAADQAVMLHCLQTRPAVLTREDLVCHFTASNWIVSPDRRHVLMAWHNIYKSWAWTGGHADGEADLMAVALREAKEETGLQALTPMCPGIYALEVVCVNSHVKRGRFVSSHLHLDCCYLWQADEAQALRVKPDENSGVAWFTLEGALAASSEPWFVRRIYGKLNEKLPSR